MKLLITTFVIGPLVLAGTLPVFGQTLRYSDQRGSIQLAAADAAERDTYTQKVRAEMLIWKQKLHDFGERTKAQAADAQTKATKNLNEAWAETKAASARVDTAAAKDWETAKTSFQNASEKLAVAWKNIGADKK